MNTTIFNQADSRWGGLPYPKRSDVAGSGCGLVSLTHIAIEQPSKKKWTPKKLRKYMIDHGYAVDGQGTKWSGITAGLKHLGHDKVVWIQSKDPMSKAWKELNKGDRIGVLLFGAGKGPDGTVWTSSGHYIMFAKYKIKNGKHWFYLKDSGPRGNSGWKCYEKSMAGCLPQMWIVKKTVADRFAENARRFAWYKRDELKYARYPEGHAKPEYKAALDKCFGKKRAWQTSAKKGASCDVFVATAIRATGIDKDAPRGLGRSYFNKSDKFKMVKVTPSTIQDGDIISIIWKNGNPHWCLAFNGYILEASLKGWYPKRTNTLKSRLSKSGKQSVVVYRAK